MLFTYMTGMLTWFFNARHKKRKDFTYAENAVSKNAFSCKNIPPLFFSAIVHALALDEKLCLILNMKDFNKYFYNPF